MLLTAVTAAPDSASPAARASGNRVPVARAILVRRISWSEPGMRREKVHAVRRAVVAHFTPAGGRTRVGRDVLPGVGIVTVTSYNGSTPGFDTLTFVRSFARAGLVRGVVIVVAIPGPGARDVAEHLGAAGSAMATTTSPFGRVTRQLGRLRMGIDRTVKATASVPGEKTPGCPRSNDRAPIIRLPGPGAISRGAPAGFT